jgi:hypothetical protein
VGRTSYPWVLTIAVVVGVRCSQESLTLSCSLLSQAIIDNSGGRGGSSTPWVLIVAVVVGVLCVFCLAACGFGLYCCFKRRKAKNAAKKDFLANSPEQKRLDDLAEKKVRKPVLKRVGEW